MLTFVSTELAGALGTVADESRHSGAERQLGEVCEHLVVATDADASVHDVDHIEGYSTSELFRTPDSVITTNVALDEEPPTYHP